jgi:hypothetical protein
MVSRKMRQKIALGAGMTMNEIRKADRTSQAIVQELMRRRMQRLGRMSTGRTTAGKEA